MFKINRFFLLLTLVLVAVAAPVFAHDDQEFPTPRQPAAPALTFLSFDKSALEEGIWEGSVNGDIVGSLRTELRDIQMAGPIGFVEFDFIVEAGEQSFTMHLNGTLNTLTGAVVMTGEVVDGAMLGATVYEQGQQINPQTGRFAGTILVIESAGA